LSQDAPEGQLTLFAIDHTHCFTCGRELTRRIAHIDTIKDRRVFGLFPEFRPLLKKEDVIKASSDLRRLSRSDVRNAVKDVPREWGVSKEVLGALVDLIVGRAKYVAEEIVGKIFREQELEFGNE
jgi:hypothetical protein